jgi:hypothetical protein
METERGEVEEDVRAFLLLWGNFLIERSLRLK